MGMIQRTILPNYISNLLIIPTIFLKLQICDMKITSKETMDIA